MTTCAVCGRNPGEACPSDLGPVSYPRCATCLGEGAESVGVICLTIFLRGGLAAAEQGIQGDGWAKSLRTYADGRYVGWPAIRALYPAYEATFRKSQAPK